MENLPTKYYFLSGRVLLNDSIFTDISFRFTKYGYLTTQQTNEWLIKAAKQGPYLEDADIKQVIIYSICEWSKEQYDNYL